MSTAQEKREIRLKIAEAANHQSMTDVAACFSCSVSTVSRIHHRAKTTGSPDKLPQSGRPSKVSECALAIIRRLLINNRRLDPQQMLHLIHQSNILISLRTLYRIMDLLKLKRYVARKKPFLKPSAKAQRLSYANNHCTDTPSDWQRTIFTDEASINVGMNYRTYITRMKARHTGRIAWYLNCTLDEPAVWFGELYGMEEGQN
jgi:transposase